MSPPRAWVCISRTVPAAQIGTVGNQVGRDRTAAPEMPFPLFLSATSIADGGVYCGGDEDAVTKGALVGAADEVVWISNSSEFATSLDSECRRARRWTRLSPMMME